MEIQKFFRQGVNVRHVKQNDEEQSQQMQGIKNHPSKWSIKSQKEIGRREFQYAFLLNLAMVPAGATCVAFSSLLKSSSWKASSWSADSVLVRYLMVQFVVLLVNCSAETSCC